MANNIKSETVTDTKLTANNNSPQFGTKRDVAAMLKLSVRTVDNFIARGMPHLKLGASLKTSYEKVVTTGAPQCLSGWNEYATGRYDRHSL
jgi:hypothetical protein